MTQIHGCTEKNIKRETETQTEIQEPKEDSLFLLDLSIEHCPLKNPVLLQCSLRKGIHSDNYAAHIFQILIILPVYICIWCVPYFLLENQKCIYLICKAQEHDRYIHICIVNQISIRLEESYSVGPWTILSSSGWIYLHLERSRILETASKTTNWVRGHPRYPVKAIQFRGDRLLQGTTSSLRGIQQGCNGIRILGSINPTAVYFLLQQSPDIILGWWTNSWSKS